MNIIEIMNEKNVGKKYESYNNEFKEIWTLKKEAKDIFELYNEDEDGITDLYYASEIVNKEFREIVDWSKIPVDAKVLVSNDGEEWYFRHFAKYEDGKIYCFNNGYSSFTIKEVNYQHTISWKYTELYEE